MTEIDLISLMHNDPKSPVRPDLALNEVGRILGPPDWWTFADDQPFSALLGYKDLEISLWARDDRIELRRMSFKLWVGSDEAILPKNKISIARNIKLRLSGFFPGMPLDDARFVLSQAGIGFVQRAYDGISEVKCSLTLESKASLIFFDMANSVALAEVHFFSHAEGA